MLRETPDIWGYIQQTQLVPQTLKKSRSTREGNRLVFNIRSMILSTQSVIRRLIIQVFVKIKFVQRFTPLIVRDLLRLVLPFSFS